MIGASLKDPLKKLPFTIPELVAASPCKSTDGTLYTGKKVDTWFSIDRFTGRKKVTKRCRCFETCNYLKMQKVIKITSYEYLNLIRAQYHLVVV